MSDTASSGSPSLSPPPARPRHGRPPGHVVVRVAEGRLRLVFEGGFTPRDVDFVKSLPGRRWERASRAWVIPEPARALPLLRAHFGVRLVEPTPDPSPPPPAPRPLLERVEEALVLRGLTRSWRSRWRR